MPNHKKTVSDHRVNKGRKANPYVHFSHIHVADGFVDDCDQLLKRCTQVEKLSYNTFCEIWKNMSFSSFFRGRNSHAELAELGDEALHIAKYYFLSETINFEENVAGLFLVYGILTLHPYPDFAMLRLVPDDMPILVKIINTARRDRRHDVQFILATVLVKYSRFHADNRERGMESGVRKYLEGLITVDKKGVRPRGVFHRQTMELDILRDLNGLSRRYAAIKQPIIANNGELCYVNSNLATELESSLKTLISGVMPDQSEKRSCDKAIDRTVDRATDGATDKATDRASDIESDTASDRASTVQAIKVKAMRKSMTQMKHIVSVEKRQSPTKTSPAKPLPTSKEPKTTKKRKRQTNMRRLELLKEPIDMDEIISEVHRTTEDEAKSSVEALDKINVASSRTKRLPDTNLQTEPKKVKHTKINPEYVSNDKESSKNKCGNRKTRHARCANIIEATESKTRQTVKAIEKKIIKTTNASDLQAFTQDVASKLNVNIESLPVLITTNEEGVYLELEVADEKGNVQNEI